ncbi:glycosyl hydrolase [Silvibacterium acidisoli]|uniref:glycosyl hydrolase n=1 Tax=Acidobacteriaceae bacterium ZG23-2 TaxID=2883246 RepID=UPI00406CF13E
MVVRRRALTTALVLAGSMSIFPPAFPQQSDSLMQGFENPPSGAHPRVWWHWMNGNISKEGIDLDLHWMHSIGVDGFQMFDAAIETPQVVPKRLVYMTPEWQDAFRFATATADKLGMEEAIAGSPGWSETGGPWVPASEGMKKYVWSATVVDGGKPFNGTLAAPPKNTGAFQDLGIHDVIDAPAGSKPIPQFYADSVTVAYKLPEDAVSMQKPTVTFSTGQFDAELLSDGDLNKTVSLPMDDKGEAWVQYAFASPQTVRGVTLAMEAASGIAAQLLGTSRPDTYLEASDDGSSFRKVVDVPNQNSPEHTVSFPEVKAKYFRVVFKKRAPGEIPDWAKGMDPKQLQEEMKKAKNTFEIEELQIFSVGRVNRFEEKAAFVPEHNLYSVATPDQPSSAVVAKDNVVDLTSKVKADGTLDWTPPPGKWVVLRFGYSLLGITNHPATAEATGLEVDKLNHKFVANYMNQYLDSYKNTVGADEMGKRGIQYVITDSWEAGAQNWTDDMIAQFKQRRGYDPVPWMPVLTGQVVGSAADSDRFLWDFRKTIADLTADEHYGQVEASIKARGMGHYGESHEGGRAFIADGMEVKKLNDIPMSAMWTQRPGVNHITYGFNADDRESASVAHIYGQNIAAAESMTAAEAPWGWSPATLKPTADQEFLNGINRFVIHESAHQPLVDKAPGLTLGPFGQWFNRNETWANEAGPWITYLARNSYMLQQGHYAADIVYFYGEDSNLTAIFAHSAPAIPPGHGFDYINADGLIHELHVGKDGALMTASGMQYRLLGLDPYSQHMSLPVLRAIYKLVQDGATLAGPKPMDDPSLADDHAEFKKLNDELFGDGSGVHKVGKGTVYAGQPLAEVFSAINLKPDFDYANAGEEPTVLFSHRRIKDGEIYFVDNRSDDAASIEASFRVTGKAPEIWHAETGTIKPASYTIADGRTTVPMHLEAWGTAFVVFRDAAKGSSRQLPEMKPTELLAVEGPWQVSFQPGRGAPASITMQTLASWSESSDPGVKYFSGAGTYTKTIDAPKDWFQKGASLYLDLGDVKNLAHVTVNGQDLGVTWHVPYRVDVSKALKPGKNEIAIKVIDPWVNRLIGDQQPGATKYTFADVTPYHADSPLVPGGLLGPVRITSVAPEK